MLSNREWNVKNKGLGCVYCINLYRFLLESFHSLTLTLMDFITSYVLVDGENVCKVSEHGEIVRILHRFWPLGVAVLPSNPLPVSYVYVPQ